MQGVLAVDDSSPQKAIPTPQFMGLPEWDQLQLLFRLHHGLTSPFAQSCFPLSSTGAAPLSRTPKLHRNLSVYVVLGI